MVGEKYWACGVVLKYSASHWNASDKCWAAALNFFDSGFCQDESTEGSLTTRYFVRIETAIDTLIADAAKLGIKVDPFLYAYGDGEDGNWPMPQGWEQILIDQARRIGWTSRYEAKK